MNLGAKKRVAALASLWISFLLSSTNAVALDLQISKTLEGYQKIGMPVLPNDPEMEQLWALYNTGQIITDGSVGDEGQEGIAGIDLNVLPLWNEGLVGSHDVIVAILDTGVQWSHPDLAANLYTNPGESESFAFNGIDDDGNGFVDDFRGWNFVRDGWNTDDLDGHGTRVAGVIGATGNNGIGITGVNWDVTLLPLKVFGEGREQDETRPDDIVDAIQYARDAGAHIIVGAWTNDEPSAAVREAIREAGEDGILFITPSGDLVEDSDQTPLYPASYDVPNLISVAAADNRGKIGIFSNYGDETIHIGAPGVNIRTTTLGSEYTTVSGTSYAAAYVAGAAALLKSIHSDWEAPELKDQLLRTAVPNYSLARKVLTHGFANTFHALHTILSNPLDLPREEDWRSRAQIYESEHNYANDLNKAYPISVEGARFIRVHFSRIELELVYDFIQIESPDGEVIFRTDRDFNDYTSDWVQGETLIVRLITDDSETRYGFRIDRVEYID